MHRSPGVFFDHDKGKNMPVESYYLIAELFLRGSWLDFEFDPKDIILELIERKNFR